MAVKQQQQQRLFAFNYKKWGMIAGAIISAFIIFKYSTAMIDNYIASVATSIFREKFEQYPTPEDVRQMKRDIEGIKSDVGVMRGTVTGIDEYLRGAGIKK